MEYLEGESLLNKVMVKGWINEIESVKIVQNLLYALN